MVHTDNNARAIVTDEDGKHWLGPRSRLFLVKHPGNDPRDLPLIFGIGADVEELPPTASVLDALVAAGVFDSKGNARKNFRGETKLSPGTVSLTVGKKNKVDIVIHCPPADLPAWEET